MIASLWLLSVIAAIPAHAVDPDEVLEDLALEERARDISKILRCVVCQSQSIDDSDAPLAKDLRLLVRERLLAGDTDDEIIDFVVARYGDYVLLKPRMSPSTVLLWTGPFLVLIIGGAFAIVTLKRRPRLAVGDGVDDATAL